MIAQLEGILSEKTPTQVIVDVRGVGYDVLIPISTFDKLGEVGSKAKLLTYLHVRQDTLQLFGFSTLKEKGMFAHLISVAGIGPKLALGILSGRTVEDLSRSIVNSDVANLTQLSGVGKKTAQRIVLELRDKLAKKMTESQLAIASGEPSANGKLEEATLALVSLGHNRNTAENALLKVLGAEPDLALDELIKRALQNS
ncbi:Holliday junction branch migration protein RuvA [candidate division KSB1 bacterium]|nr:Holliday junction branch migration protein RuvA [candidate division KSB1 bacterium]